MKQQQLLQAFLIGLLVMMSCNKKRLDQPALGQLDETKLATRKGVETLLIGAYGLLDGYSYDAFGTVGWWSTAASNWIYGSICGSEAYKGSEQNDQGPTITPFERFSSSATNSYVNDKWAVVYGGAQRANTVIRVMRKATDILAADTIRIKAEALFLRAYYHFEAVKMWQYVPFVDEYITVGNGNYHMPNDTLIWGAIETDLKFAVAHLPETQVAVGRANKWSAMAYLAKAYLFQKKYAAAKPLLDDLIQNGATSNGIKYTLVNFADNFNPATKNSGESVFAAQMWVNDGSTTPAMVGNGNIGDVLNFPFGQIGEVPGGCCGFFQPSQYLVNHFKTDPVTGLPDLENFNKTDVKNDEGIPSSAPFVPYAGTLDPRLDWTVGRRGVPYLDWGIHKGWDWVRFPQNGGPYSPIKNVYYKSQEGEYNDANFWSKGLTANNVNLVRFADILLWAAETEAKLNNLEKAREYINMVRQRATNPNGWVKNSSGPYAPYAANYKIGLYQASDWISADFALKAIRYERVLELGMEGHRFFDLVRWDIADQEINTYLQKEQTIREHLKNAVFIKGKSERFPIPQRQIDLSAGFDGIPKMKQNPGY